MTPVTALELEFADGDYLFDLKIPQLAELQEKRGPLFKVYGRVLKGRYLLAGEAVGVPAEGEAFAEDLFETIRLGLIGGGLGVVNGQEVKVNAITANKLVQRYCHEMPLRDSWSIAAMILDARINGYTPEKKAEPAEKPATRKRRSTSRRSSRTAASSDATGAS